MWALYELDAAGVPTLRFDGTQEDLELLYPDQAVDLDGDGEPELLFLGTLAHGHELGVLKRRGARYEPVGGVLAVYYHHCHC